MIMILVQILLLYIDHAMRLNHSTRAPSSDLNAASTIPAARSTRGSSPAADGASAAVASSSHVGRLNTSHHRHGERAWAARIAGEGARAVLPPGSGTHARASNDKLVAVKQQPTQRRGGMYPLLVACPRPVAAMASTTVSKAALAMTPRLPNRDSERDPPPSPPPMPFVVAPTTAADHHAGGTMARRCPIDAGPMAAAHLLKEANQEAHTTAVARRGAAATAMVTQTASSSSRWVYASSPNRAAGAVRACRLAACAGERRAPRRGHPPCLSASRRRWRREMRVFWRDRAARRSMRTRGGRCRAGTTRERRRG